MHLLKKYKFKSYIPLFTMAIIVLIFSLLNWPILVTLWRHSFDDGTYSHAYLIPIIVGYLFYTLSEAKELNVRERFSLPAFSILLTSSYLLFVTSTAQISLGYWLATLLLLCAAINFIFKNNIKVLFAACYLIFLMPLWGLLTIPLQDLSVMAVNTMMSFTTIPVYVEDQFVHIPSGVFEIAGGCSGLRYLLTSLAISSLYIFLYLRTTKNIVLFAFTAILGALLTNWIRISLLIIIGHQTEMTSSLMEDHNTFGWYLYLPFMLLLFKFGAYLTDKESAKAEETHTKKQPSASKPQVALYGILFLVLIISSTAIKQKTIDSQTRNELSRTTFTQIKIKPTIHYYSTVEVIKNNISDTHVIYSFNGDDLDGKPTYFDNDLIPANWRIIKKSKNERQQTYLISKGSKQAELTVSYEINGEHFGRNKAFKIARLKSALIGLGTTRLHWSFKIKGNK